MFSKCNPIKRTFNASRDWVKKASIPLNVDSVYAFITHSPENIAKTCDAFTNFRGNKITFVTHILVWQRVLCDTIRTHTYSIRIANLCETWLTAQYAHAHPALTTYIHMYMEYTSEMSLADVILGWFGFNFEVRLLDWKHRRRGHVRCFYFFGQICQTTRLKQTASLQFPQKIISTESAQTC